MRELGSPECNRACGYSIIILYALQTQRHVKSKFNHSKSIYLNDIYLGVNISTNALSRALGLKANVFVTAEK